jgi:subtilisin family serine protease
MEARAFKDSNQRQDLSALRRELQSTEHVPDELIVGYSTDRAPATLAETLGGRFVESFSLGDSVARLKLPPQTDLAKALHALRESPGVTFAETNQIIRLTEVPSSAAHQPTSDDNNVPNDLDEQLWGLANKTNPGADISAVAAWQMTTGSNNGPLIAVIDSGADYTHPDLAANIAVNTSEIPGDGLDNDGNGVVDDVYGFNAFENHGDPMDGMGHGTHCTGTIAAEGNNGHGIVGVQWQAQVLPVKIFHDRGLTTTDSILRGLEYAKSRGAVITSNSWGGPQPSEAIRQAFASFPGALHIAAAGNDEKNTDQNPSYPADYDLPNMISVGASNSHDAPAWFTNFGRESVDVFAPGEDILSTLPGGGYGKKSGTSMATPHVTGAAGLIATKYPKASPEALRDRLLYSSDPLEPLAGMAVTEGRLNAHRALSEDQIAPAAPNDFWVTERSPRSVRFSWTATGDDGWQNGAASGFEVRVSRQPIDETNWRDATPLPTPRGKEIGDHLHAHYHQNPESRPNEIHAAFRALDEAGNRSDLLTTSATLPAATVVFQDNFDGEQSAWSADGRWKKEQVESRGQVWSSKHGQSKDTFSTLRSPVIDLGKSQNAFLRFESRQDFAWANNVFLELTSDAGETWTRLDTLKDRGEWKQREYDLSAHDGQKVQIRVRSENLGAKDGDGVLVDAFEVLGDL